MALNADVEEAASRWLMATYLRAPVEFVRGEGAMLWDSDGKEYLDFLSGISVCSVGHCHPVVVEAVREQAGKLMHVSNLFHSRSGAQLAELLCRSSLGGRAFLCNSGTEANECAIKLVRKAAHLRGIADPEVVVLDGAFHGRTMGALSATPGMASNPAFAPYLPGFRPVARDDPDGLRAAVGKRTAAVLLEPIQGEAGVHVIADSVIAAAREACDAVGAILIFDEIQCGMGRTGSLWAFEQLSVRPDVITTAKALGGGLPVGACVCAPELADILEPGDHGSTFAGGPLVARAAVATLGLINDPALLRQVRAMGEELSRGLAGLSAVAEVRGRGLMIGVGLAEGVDSAALAARLLADGLIVNAPNPRTLRLLPPLVIEPTQIERALKLLAAALE